MGLLCRRRPERELAGAVQSLGVAAPVAAVTVQGQGLLVAGAGRRVIPGLLLHEAGQSLGPATSPLLPSGCGELVRKGWCLVGSQLPGLPCRSRWLSDV